MNQFVQACIRASSEMGKEEEEERWREGGGSGPVKREEGLRFLAVRVGQREWHGIVKRHLFNK